VLGKGKRIASLAVAVPDRLDHSIQGALRADGDLADHDRRGGPFLVAPDAAELGEPLAFDSTHVAPLSGERVLDGCVSGWAYRLDR
jgi:hypothetical protein